MREPTNEVKVERDVPVTMSDGVELLTEDVEMANTVDVPPPVTVALPGTAATDGLLLESETAAPVGGVLVGHETYTATRSAIEYRPASPVAAKGKAEPVRAWLAVRPTTPAGERALTPIPIVGRERELDVLRRIWDDVSTQRRPALVTVFGPAGIGKSRLALELAEHVTALGGLALRGRSAHRCCPAPTGSGCVRRVRS